MDNNTQIPAEKFYEVFCSDFKVKVNEKPSILGKKYRDNSSWTKYMTEFLDKLGKEKFKFHTDFKFWPRTDIAYFDKETRDNWSEWSYEVAIEIENDSESWEEECHKLMLLQCGLKVLISYSDRDISSSKVRLDEFKKYYKSRKYNRKKEEYLFIFLPWSTLIESYREIRAYKVFNDCPDSGCVTELKKLPDYSF